MRSLCGYRTGGNANTSDNNDALSKELGRELFDVLGVSHDRPGPDDPGHALERCVSQHLAELRPDLLIGESSTATAFEQYEHLSAFPRYRRGHRRSEQSLAPLHDAVGELASPGERALLQGLLHKAAAAFHEQDDLALKLLAHMPEEALLKIDITVGEPHLPRLPRLHVI